MSDEGLPVIPELDVLQSAFSRQDPDPALVRAVETVIDERRLFLVGWVRQGLLERTRDDRQFHRLMVALAPFPDVPISPGDHLAAAHLSRDLRRRGAAIQPAQSLLWVMMERVGGRIWTREARWRRLAIHGAPLLAT